MNKKTKPTITYVKNNEEKTLTLNIWTELTKLSEIFLKNQSGMYVIREEIDLVHFKNWDFELNYDHPTTTIECPKNTVCILEHCNFLGEMQKGYHELRIKGGSFQLIHPNLDKISKLKTCTTDFSLTLANRDQAMSPTLKVSCEEGNIHIRDCKQIAQLGIFNVENVFLENEFELFDFSILEADKLTIGTDEIPTIIKLEQFNAPIATRELILNNCTIDTSHKLEIYSPNITGSKYLISSEQLSINQNQYYEPTTQGRTPFILTDKSLQELQEKNRIISLLKARKNQLETSIYKKTEQYLEPQNRQIKAQEQIIKEAEAQIEELGQQRLITQNQIIKSLSRKKPKEFLENN